MGNLFGGAPRSLGMQKWHQLGVETFVEIGPKPTLLAMGRRCLGATLAWRDEYATWLPSLRPDAEWSTLLPSLAQLYVRGVEIDWAGFYRDNRRSKIVLPTYPFQRERYWVEERGTGKQTLQSLSAPHPLLGHRLPQAADLPNRHVWQVELKAEKLSYLDDHRVQGVPFMPGGLYLEMVLAAAAEVYGARAVTIQEMA